MTLWTGPILLLVVLVWPLLLAGLTALHGLRERGVRLLPLAPLPALWLALAGNGEVLTAPDLLLGVTLGLDGSGRLLLGMTAVLWALAGLAAQPIAESPRSAIFSGFWLLTLTGNLAVFLALDIVTFYVAFATVSLASWFLIVHSRSTKALHAGRIYIIMALAGEVALLVGLIMGANAAGSLAIADVRDALSITGLALLVVGFGIKAGLVPLHVWLPLAHPAAPVPASAVLSGAIVKAGLIGLILFLPEGVFGPVLIGLGLAGTFGAALWGLTQQDAKAVLAYSTVSQMGLMIMLIGAAGAAREAAPYYALHHGFAKGALFLLVGVMLAAQTRGQRLVCLGVAALVCGSVAGLPLTGGALAKAAVKDGLPEALALALSLSSVTTSLILIWFLARLWQVERPGSDKAASWLLRLLIPVLAGGLAFACPWGLWSFWTGREPEYLFAAATIRDALWPVAIALPVGLLLVRKGLPSLPPGDLLLVLGRLRMAPLRLPSPTLPALLENDVIRAIPAATGRAEHALVQWRLGGPLIVLLVLLMFWLLAG